MLNERHTKEISGQSCVSEEITTTAFFTVEDEFDAAAYTRLSTTELGTGWAVNCVIPYTGKSDKIGGQFKPDTPSPKLGENGEPLKKSDGSIKYNKYLSRAKGGTPMFLAMPDEHYWRKVIEDEGLPFLITEGAKKAGAALSLGYACCAIAGVDNWAEPGTKGEERILHPHLQDFMVPGRVVYICYDADWHTNYGVKLGITKIAKECEKFNGVEVRLLMLPNDSEAKGLDDYIKKHGGEEFKKALKGSVSLKDFQAGDRENVTEWQIDSRYTQQKNFLNFWAAKYSDDCIHVEGGWIRRFGQHWRFIKEFEIKQMAVELLNRMYEVRTVGKEKRVVQNYTMMTSQNLTSCMELLKTISTQNIKIDYNHICFKNGYLDLETREFREMIETDRCLSVLEYDYTPNSAECPTLFSRFISASYGLEQLEYIRAFTSWVLDPTAPWDCFPFLTGKSRSGKSTLIDVWMSMLPEHMRKYGNSLNILLTPETRAQLVGYRAYAVSDLTEFLNNPGALYDFVENRPLCIRQLYSTSAPSIKLHCRLIIGAVESCRIRGARDGWDGRVRYISTKEVIDVIEDVPNLKKALEKEIPAIANWALAMDTRERDKLLRTSFNSKVKNEAELDNDAIKAFLDDCFELAADEDHEIEISSQLYPMFKSWAASTKHGTELKEKTFVSRMRATLPLQYRIDGNVVYENGRNIRKKVRTKGLKVVSVNIFNQRQPGVWDYDPQEAVPGGLLRLGMHKL